MSARHASKNTVCFDSGYQQKNKFSIPVSCPCLIKLDLARSFARKSSQLKFLKALKKKEKAYFQEIP